MSKAQLPTKQIERLQINSDMCDTEPSRLAPTTTTTSPTSPTAPPSTYNAPYDPAYYTWSLFFRGLTGQASDDSIRKYLHNRSLVKERSDCTQCEKWRDWLFQYSPVVNFLRQNVEKLGGELDARNVICRRCDTLDRKGIKQGAFAGEAGILLCANHVRDRKSMEDVLAHEMVHAYDFMRFRVEKGDLRHAACTEIRANLLSGECRWTREFFKRKQYSFTQHFQDCVRRRAILAVKMHEGCKDETQATRVVNDVWGSCFADTRPFDEIYR